HRAAEARAAAVPADHDRRHRREGAPAARCEARRHVERERPRRAHARADRRHQPPRRRGPPRHRPHREDGPHAALLPRGARARTVRLPADGVHEADHARGGSRGDHDRPEAGVPRHRRALREGRRHALHLHGLHALFRRRDPGVRRGSDPRGTPGVSHLRFESENPGKRAAERWYLLYTPVWGAVSAAVMLTGLAERWDEPSFLLYGLGLWLGVLLPPFVWRAPADRGKPALALYHAKFQAWMLLFACFGNWWSKYFYEVLHMQYGFPTPWTLNHVPLFLYFVTVAYFTTYGTLLNMGWRAARSLLADRPPWVGRGASVPGCLPRGGARGGARGDPRREAPLVQGT